MDEVLCYFVRNLALFANEKMGTNLTEKDYFSYYFYNVWKNSNDECQAIVREFFDSKYFEDLPEVPHCKEVLTRLSKDFDLIIITSRQSFLEKQTNNWLDKHLPDLFKERIICNHFNTQGKTLKKVDVCKEYGACVMIDDNVKYSQECADVVQYDILFGNYAWNTVPEGETLKSNIKRLNDWLEIENYINNIVKPSLKQ
ncbi:hypothetical protein WA158_001304 [Blastocystis sp. Blastoise]